MLAYSLVQQLFLLNNYNLISSDFKEELTKSIDLLDANENSIKVEAEEIANKIHQEGFKTVQLDISEFEKADGGLTCLSIILKQI